MKKHLKILIFLTSCFIFQVPVHSQYFGKNKVNYEVFDFKIYETPHFKIYHYIEDEEEVENFARLCERWYERHQEIFFDTLVSKKPVILYNDHPDFQQTTAVQSIIGVGTGGVTEGYRQRLIMPYSASNSETNHVLGHEMVHVYQYNVFKKQDSLGLRSIGNVPIWMIEGLAEYLSVGRSDVKTAMWMRDAVQQDDIPTFRQMSREPNEYFPYRYGHAFWVYLTGLYGDGIIRPLLFGTGKSGYEKALDSLTSFSADSLSQLWAIKLKETHSPYLEGKKESIGEKLFDVSNAGEMNIAPSISPDGEDLIFISDKNVLSIDYFLADINEKTITKQITNVVRGAHIDAYSFLESAGTWSPDGKHFAITTFIQGRNKLLIVNLEQEKIVNTIEPGKLESFNNPRWSPDGKKILLSGLKSGNSDIYLYHLETEQLEQLTDDEYSDLLPSWSPDGSKVVFVSDRSRETDFQQLKYGNFKMTIYDLEAGNLQNINILEGADIFNPMYSPDGSEIYFVSNANGYRNLYRYNPESQETRKLTDFQTGVSGITDMSPCFDISHASEELVYILYRNDDYTLYKQNLSELDGPLFTSMDVDLQAAEIVASEEDKRRVIIDEVLEEYPEADTSRFKYRPYDKAFSLETIGNTGIGVGASRYGTGMAGGISLLFSDVLRRHLLMTALQVQGRIYDIAGQVYYLNQKTRFNWGASFSHVPYRSSRAFLKRDTTEEMVITNLVLMQQRTFEDELSLMGQYPLSKKLRIEGGITASRYSFRIDSINNYYSGNLRLGRESQQVDAPDPFYLYRSYLAYVGDNSTFGLTSPMRGYRYRFQGERVFGEFGYWGVLTDYRKYFFFSPSALGFRLMHYGRYGRSADELYPMFLGNQYYVRGYSYGSMSRTRCNAPNCLSVNNLVGSKIFVGNVEFRYPLSGPKRLALIKSRLFFSDLVLFADGGLVWSDFEDIEFNWEPRQEDEVHIPIYSAGIAVRINLFGAIILEPYYAFPFQRPEAKSSGTFGLHLSAGGF